MKLLVTLDGSSESEAILPNAVALAQAAKAEVTLLTVASPEEGEYPQRREHENLRSVGASADASLSAIEEPPTTEPFESHGQALERVASTAEDYLAPFATRLKAEGLTVEQKVILSEHIAQSITEYARSEGFDLIAMSTHGRSGLSSLIQGSVASAVVRSGVAPILLVRPLVT
ncbi:MAG TPA: universal stress protein [Dehalococcoidia bacterium]|nr:universal stress protein [Dehalococcoidia bacterium]